MKGFKLDDLPERYRRQIERQFAIPHRPAVPSPNVERAPCRQPVAAPRHPKVDTRCRIRMLCRRHTLADPDGISAKALIDSLVLCGILSNDSTREIADSPQITQVKVPASEREETIVEIYKE